MSVSQAIVWFGAFSLAGWVFESAYCAIKGGHWEKRGFLIGPVCPIYGVGAVAALLIFDNPAVVSGEFPWWAVFLVSMAGSAVLEYATSLTLEKAFGTVWWDYSDMPLNFNGRICLPASLLFGIGGTAVTYGLLPLVAIVNLAVPAVVFEFAALFIVALIAADATTTLATLTDLMEKITSFDTSFNQRMEDAYQAAGDAVRTTPVRLKISGAEKLAEVREDAAEKIEHVQELTAEQRARMQENAAERKERLQKLTAESKAHAQEFASSLTLRQRKMLHNMKRFRSTAARGVAEKLREALGERLRDSLEERRERKERRSSRDE